MFQKEKNPQSIHWNIQEWYILVENSQRGPYSLSDLKNDDRLTPDTLIWKRDFPDWIKARFVPEMQELFKDHLSNPQPLHGKEIEGLKGDVGPESQATLALQQDPYSFILWILLILLILFYSFYHFHDQF